ncbi:PG0870-related protein [Leeuwenhoekiella sp. NPDC079379]|uniref:PG0870-related protein n=1 Tax=Leeuwenhoekiella sp. NPDC079379 TaxID=3364122 RepID=UPI0037C8EEF7
MYKYTLEKKSVKHICPGCNKKRFVRYVDSETNEYLSHIVGRCDREVNCAYHYSPKSYFEDRSCRLP